MDSDTFRIPFENEKFDIVISNQVFEHVADYDLAFKEISRVLKKEGISLNFFHLGIGLLRHTLMFLLLLSLKINIGYTYGLYLVFMQRYQIGHCGRLHVEMKFI